MSHENPVRFRVVPPFTQPRSDQYNIKLQIAGPRLIMTILSFAAMNHQDVKFSFLTLAPGVSRCPIVRITCVRAGTVSYTHLTLPTKA